MIVLGIDPGATTGWCMYDTEARRVLEAGQFDGYDVPLRGPDEPIPDVIVLERPKGYGPTRPQLVDCGYIAGRLVERAGRIRDVYELTRLDVKKTLTAATLGEINVRTDATAWAALKLLHGGDDSAKKGGPLYGCKAHERAALAVAVAWVLRQEEEATP